MSTRTIQVNSPSALALFALLGAVPVMRVEFDSDFERFGFYWSDGNRPVQPRRN